MVFFFAPCSKRKPSRTPASAPTSSGPSSPPAEQAAVKTDVVEKEVADISSECDTATPEVQQKNEQQKKDNGEVKESSVVEKKNGEVARKDVEMEKKPGEVKKVDGEPKHEEGTTEDIVVEEDVHGITPVSCVLFFVMKISQVGYLVKSITLSLCRHDSHPVLPKGLIRFLIVPPVKTTKGSTL